MRHMFHGAILLLVLAPAAFAQNDKGKDKPKPDKPDTPAAAGQKELQELNADFQKAQQELSKPLNNVKSQEEAEKIIEKENLVEKEQKLMAEFSKRAFAIAEKHAKESDVAMDALIWIVNNAETSPEAAKAIDLLIRDHLDNKKIDTQLLPRIVHMPLEANEKLIRAVLEKADTPERKASVRLQLAKFLKGKADAIDMVKTLDEKTKKLVEMRLGKEFLTKLSAGDKAKVDSEAEGLFEAIVKDAEKEKSISPNVKKEAESELFEMKYLAIGKPAQEIEGEDIDGKKFKLSDYKGKVVVIDFWGNW